MADTTKAQALRRIQDHLGLYAPTAVRDDGEEFETGPRPEPLFEDVVALIEEVRQESAPQRAERDAKMSEIDRLTIAVAQIDQRIGKFDRLEQACLKLIPDLAIAYVNRRRDTEVDDA